MSGLGKHGLICLVIVALVSIPLSTPILAEEVKEKEAQETPQPGDPQQEHAIEGEKMIADVIFVRPLSLVTTVVTSVVFVIALPFTILGGNTGDAYKQLVAKPAAYTFDRKLGDF